MDTTAISDHYDFVGDNCLKQVQIHMDRADEIKKGITSLKDSNNELEVESIVS